MTSTRSATSGRAALVLMLAVIAALAVFFVVADPLGVMGDLNRSGAEPDDLGDMGPGYEDGPAQPVDDEVRLAGMYGEGDLGGIRLRLLEVKDRQPIVNQALRLVARGGAETMGVTGADGVALFGSLSPGRRYQLEIAVEGHRHIRMPGIRVAKGELNDLGDILVGTNVVVRGRVIDGSGRPIPGTSVAVFTPTESFTQKGMLFSMAEQVTTFASPLDDDESDGEGWFVLDALVDGTYRLEARRAGYATRYESDIVVSEDRSVRDMTIVLSEGAMVTGHVRDDQGSPVVDARVVAIRDFGRRMGPAAETLQRDIALTDASGAFTLDTLSQGTRYRFGVIAEGFASNVEMRGEVLEQKREVKDFVLVKGGSIEGRIVATEGGAPVADAEVLVMVGRMPFGRGRRAQSGGDGQSDKVNASRTRTNEQGFFTIEDVLPGPVMSAQVRADGFVPYTQSQFMGGESWGEIAGGEVLEVGAIELQGGGTITGTVTDASTGDAVANADVMVMSRARFWEVFVSGAPQARTGLDGTYTISGVAPGEYGIRAVAPGYAPGDATAEESKLDVKEVGSVTKRDLQLARAGSVTGIVTNAVGEPVAGARVRTRIGRAPASERQQGQQGRGRGRGGANRMNQMLPGNSGSDLTDLEGRFVIDGVSSDQYWVVRAEADEYVEAETEPFRVDVGQQKELTIVLLGGGRLAGRVVDESGRFIEGAVVRVGRLPPDRAATARLRSWEADRYLEPGAYTTAEDGTFLATDIPPGRALVKVEHDDYVTFYKRNVQIRADETTENYMATLKRGDVLEGVVKSQDGTPVEGAMVGATMDPNPMAFGRGRPAEATAEEEEVSEDIEPQAFARTDKDGKFKIEDVTPGTVSVVVWFAPGFQSWRRQQDEGSIKRDVSSSSKGLEFRLTPSESGGVGLPQPGRR